MVKSISKNSPIDQIKAELGVETRLHDLAQGKDISPKGPTRETVVRIADGTGEFKQISKPEESTLETIFRFADATEEFKKLFPNYSGALDAKSQQRFAEMMVQLSQLDPLRMILKSSDPVAKSMAQALLAQVDTQLAPVLNPLVPEILSQGANEIADVIAANGFDARAALMAKDLGLNLSEAELVELSAFLTSESKTILADLRALSGNPPELRTYCAALVTDLERGVAAMIRLRDQFQAGGIQNQT